MASSALEKTEQRFDPVDAASWLAVIPEVGIALRRATVPFARPRASILQLEAAIGKLGRGGDATNPTYPQRANGNVFLRSAGPTPPVAADASRDQLTGAAGDDWFFAHLNLDSITDKSDAE